MLEDEGRVLFLKHKDRHGIERLEMPCVMVYSGRSPVAEIKEKFREYTGIDGEVHEVIIETRHNAGSRKRKSWVPCLVFRITAKERRARPSKEFSGFRWLSMDDAKKEKLGRNAKWMLRFRRTEEPKQQAEERTGTGQRR
jgi:hypothetical protein